MSAQAVIILAGRISWTYAQIDWDLTVVNIKLNVLRAENWEYKFFK